MNAAFNRDLKITTAGYQLVSQARSWIIEFKEDELL